MTQIHPPKHLHVARKITLFIVGIVFLAGINTHQTNAADYFFKSNNSILWHDESTKAKTACKTAVSAVGSIGNVPEPWNSLIANAATKYPDVDARLVAATLYIENRGWPPEDKTWAESSAGAKGPWQFIDSTWASMGQDGDGDGKKDPNNPKDAVLAAFIHQKGSAGKPLIEGYTGDIEAGLKLKFQRDRQNLLSFMASYNGRGAPDGVALEDFPSGENADYVIMSYYVIASNFTQTWSSTTGEVEDIAGAKGATEGESGELEGDCGSEGGESGYVNTEGFSFPIGLPKSRITYGYGKLPCTRDSCHHDNTYAFDLFGEVGTPVFAIEQGEIEGLNDGYNDTPGCFSIHLTGKSGWKYWYGHIKSPVVTPGQKVQPGDKLAVVGESVCALDTAPHLHIDRGGPEKGTSGGRDCCRSKTINNLINSLYADMPG